jgi:hypothetical protein
MDTDLRHHLLVAEAPVKERSDDPADRVPESAWPGVGIWFGFLAPPAAALLHLLSSFVLGHTACSTQSKIQLHVVTLVLIVVIVVSGQVARRKWVELGSGSPHQLPGPLGSRRLMALLGMIGAVVFGMVVLAQWFPNTMLDVCVRT